MADDKEKKHNNNYLRSLIGGDMFLSGKAMRKQIGMVVRIVALIIFYIDNR